MNALYNTTPSASSITTFSLTYYYPHGLQVLPLSALLTTTPMGFRHYHLQPYYYPHGLQVLPPSALQTTTPLGFRYYQLQPYNPCNYSLSQPFIFVGFSFCSIVGQCNFFFVAEKTMAILFGAKLYRLTRIFLLFSCSVIVLVRLKC